MLKASLSRWKNDDKNVRYQALSASSPQASTRAVWSTERAKWSIYRHVIHLKCFPDERATERVWVLIACPVLGSRGLTKMT